MTVKSSVLGDVIKNINIPNDPSDITVLGDAIWAGTLNDPKLYKININTGAEITHYEVGFAVYGLTTDGTYLYASLKEVGNGTIFKLDTSGNIISTFEIEVDNFFHGLAYDGNSLWAYHHSGNLLKINPDTGVVLANYTNDNPIAGLTYFNGYVWGIAYNKDEIHAFDPDTGRVQEVFQHSLSGFGEFGLAQNGTHFLISFFHNDSISFLEYPTEIGEVFNIYDPSIDHPLGMDWNGTHFFVADRITDTVHIYHDGTFELIDTIALGYDPIGVVVVGNYFYVASHESPYNIYKYSFEGALIATFSTGIHCYDLAYDGNYIYLTWYNDVKISKLDPTDCTLIETYAIEEKYAGITYDSLNNVFWGVGYDSNKIYQLDTTVFNKTGIQYDIPTTFGEYGLCFDEDHLIMNAWSTDKFYKIIINFRPALPINPIPSHNEIDISINPTLSVEVSDPNDDELTVTFYNATDDSIIGTDIVSGGHGNASITLSNLLKNTEYDWYVIVDDGIDSRQSSTWSFITEKESPPTGIPGYNVLIVFSILIGFGILLFQMKKRHR